MNFEERMLYAKIILKELRYGPVPWSDLEKKVFTSGGTHWKFTSIMSWLTENDFVVKEGPSGSRSPYRFNSERVRFDDGEVILKL